MIPISYPSPRVSQLDANVLDSELHSLLSQQLSSVFHLQSSKWWGYSQHPELWDLLLELLAFRLTTWRSGSSYGLSLQNLKLTDFKSGKSIGHYKRGLLLSFIIGKYAFRKIESYVYSLEDYPRLDPQSIVDRMKEYLRRNRLTILSKIDDSLKVLNVINFTLFLINGRFPSLLHRALGISLTPVVSDLLKFNGDNVNFEFQNRQLVWNVMTEFLVFILPLLKLRKLKRMTQKILSLNKGGDKEFSQSVGTTPVLTPFTNLPLNVCAICHLNNQKSGRNPHGALCLITNPHVTNCGHVFCYVCLATRLNAKENGDEESEGCLRCGIRLQWFEEYGIQEADVDQDAILVEYEDTIEKPESEYEDDSGDEIEDEKTSAIGSKREDEHEKSDREFSDYSEGEEFDEDEDVNYDDLDDDDFDEGMEM